MSFASTRCRSPRSLLPLALLPAGTLAGHGLAYATADPHHRGLPHGYLSLATWLAVPIAVAALAWFARQGASGSRSRLPVAVVLAQPVLFFVQEATEHLVTGERLATLLASPILRWGLVFQALTAAVLLLASVGACLVGAVAADAWRRRSHVMARSGQEHRDRLPPPVIRTRRPCPSTSERGPPHLLVPA